jgi:GntR family transcriptional regulator
LNRINRDISTPLYEQLKLIVREQIMMGELTPGAMLPSELAYCEQHQVSRITVSRALSDLEREGFIRRIQGKGSIVITPRYHDTLKSIKGFSRTVAEAGNDITSKLLSADSFTGNLSIASLFNLPLDHEHRFMRFQRLRFVNGEPAVIMTNIVLESLGLRLMEYDLESASFYNLYEKILGLPVIRNEAHLIPITATPEIVELLIVKPGSPHFLFRGVSFLEGDIPVESCVAVFHGSTFQFSTEIYRLSDKQMDGPEAHALVFSTG